MSRSGCDVGNARRPPTVQRTMDSTPRTGWRRRPPTTSLLALLAATALAACGPADGAQAPSAATTTSEAAPSHVPTAPPDPVTPPPTDPSPPDPSGVDEPPDLVVTSEAGTSHRRPYTWCRTTAGAGVCADGRPTADGRVDVRGTLQLSLPLDGWTLAATRWIELDDPEGPRVRLRSTGEGRWEVAERLPRGPHILEISGRGPQGDAFWAVPVTVLDGS